MLDSLVKYERDKRNFVRYNCNGCGLFIVERTRYILMVTTILRAGRGGSVVLKQPCFFSFYDLHFERRNSISLKDMFIAENKMRRLFIGCYVNWRNWISNWCLWVEFFF